MHKEDKKLGIFYSPKDAHKFTRLEKLNIRRNRILFSYGHLYRRIERLLIYIESMYINRKCLNRSRKNFPHLSEAEYEMLLETFEIAFSPLYTYRTCNPCNFNEPPTNVKYTEDEQRLKNSITFYKHETIRLRHVLAEVELRVDKINFALAKYSESRRKKFYIPKI